MIKLQVVGSLGKDATVNTVNGKNVINFSVAHTERYKDAQGNKQEKTTWVDCALWANSTALAPYLTKGTKVYVEGDPSARGYSKADGTASASLSVRVSKVELIGGGNKNGSTNATTSNQESFNEATDDVADDLPF